MNINIKELCKQIKKSPSIIWTVQNGTHYVTNRHWAVRYTELPREVLIQLFCIFAEIPKEGETISFSKSYGFVSHSSANVERVFKDQEKVTDTGLVTPYLKTHDDYGNLRIIKIGKEFAYINEDYMKLVTDCESTSVVCSGRLSPISFYDNMLIILPVRTANEKDSGVINELLAS